MPGWSIAWRLRNGTKLDRDPMVGNVLAILTLLSWPVISAIMFQRMEARRAFVWSILGAYMSL